MTWEITIAQFGSDELAALLAEGWEPFAVREQGLKPEASYVWLRRSTGL